MHGSDHAPLLRRRPESREVTTIGGYGSRPLDPGLRRDDVMMLIPRPLAAGWFMFFMETVVIQCVEN